MTTVAPGDDVARPELAVFGLAGVFVFGVAVVCAGLLVGMRPEHVPILCVAVVSGMIALVPPVLDLGRAPNRRHVLLTTLSLAWVVFFVVPVFTRYFMEGGYDPSEITTILSVLPDDVVTGQLVVLLGYLSLVAGYATPFGRPLAGLLPTARHDWPPATGLAIASFMIPLGWAVYLAGQFGVVPMRAGSGALGVIAGSTIFGIALLGLLYMRYGSRIAYLMLWVVIPLTMAFNFFTGSKGRFLAPLAMLPLTYVVVRRRFRLRWAVAAVVAFALLYPIAQFYREIILEQNTKLAVEVLAEPGRALERMARYAGHFEFGQYFADGLRMTGARFSGLDIASIIVRDTPDRVPYQGGWSIGYIFVSLVPRLLWADKPIVTIGQWVTDNYSGGPYIRSQTGPSWIGELYFNFGLPGVLVGMLLLGLYFRILHETVYRTDASLPLAWLGVILIFQLAPTLGGGLVAPINTVPFYGGFILILHLATRLIGASSPMATATTRRHRTASATRLPG